MLKSLEKDPSARYATVSALADDITRFLNDEPILARPHSLGYQVRKLIRRHRLPFALSGLVLVLLIAFGAVSSALALRLHRERLAAVAARDRESAARRLAEEERAGAESVAGFIQDLLAAADPTAPSAGRDVTLRQVLDRAGTTMSEGALAQQPSVAVTLRTTIGNAYRAIGLYEQADMQIGEAVALGRHTFGEAGHPALAQALNKQGRLYEDRGRYEEAEAAFREALEMLRGLHGEVHSEVAKLLNNLGMLLQRRGRHAEAESSLRQALRVRRGLSPQDTAAIATILNNLGLSRRAGGDLSGAEALFRESLELGREALGSDNPNIASTMANLAVVLGDRGRLTEAEGLLRESLAMKRRLLGDAHPDVAISLSNLALNLTAQQRLEEAESLYREALMQQHEFFGCEHPAVATTTANLAVLLGRRGELAEAERMHREALAIREIALGEGHPDTIASMYHLSGTFLLKEQFSQAEDLAGRNVARARNALTSDHWLLGMCLGIHAKCLGSQGRLSEAEPLYIESKRILESSLGAEHSHTRSVAEALAGLRQELSSLPADHPKGD